jgi:hypothetical protein
VHEHQQEMQQLRRGWACAAVHAHLSKARRMLVAHALRVWSASIGLQAAAADPPTSGGSACLTATAPSASEAAAGAGAEHTAKIAESDALRTALAELKRKYGRSARLVETQLREADQLRRGWACAVVHAHLSKARLMLVAHALYQWRTTCAELGSVSEPVAPASSPFALKTGVPSFGSLRTGVLQLSPVASRPAGADVGGGGGGASEREGVLYEMVSGLQLELQGANRGWAMAKLQRAADGDSALDHVARAFCAWQLAMVCTAKRGSAVRANGGAGVDSPTGDVSGGRELAMTLCVQVRESV